MLGNLFKSTARAGEKTNLFIFLTPHVVENPAEAKKIMGEKKERMDQIKAGKIKMHEWGTGETKSDDSE